MRADRFEHVLNRHLAPVKLARRNRSAVEHDARDVQARQRHDRAGNRLVAADQHDEAVEAVAARHELDRIGDHLAADERGAHPFGAHRDAVGDRDGVELHRRAAGGADAFLDVARPASRRCRLQGPISIQVLATPMSGFFRSASEKPAAFSMARAGARLGAGRQRIGSCGHACISTEVRRRTRVAAAGFAARIRTEHAQHRRELGQMRQRASARQIVARRREVDVEEIFPRAARHRPRLELGQIDAAQREHAQRLEQRARLVGQREHDRRLVVRLASTSGRLPMTRNRVMLCSKSWIDERSGVRPNTSPARADAIAAASRQLLGRRSSSRCRPCRRSR